MMRRELAFGAVALAAALFVSMTIQGTASTPMPDPTLNAPADLCYGAISDPPPGLDVYAARHDEKRAIAALVEAAKKGETCVNTHPTDNAGLRVLTLQGIGAFWAAAADMAFSIRDYKTAKEAALASNRSYESVLAILTDPKTSWIQNQDRARANIQVNDDLLQRIPR